MKFVQFRLHSIILNYNYFVYNSVDKLLIIFQFEFNLVDGGGGVILFQKCERSQGGTPLRTCTNKGAGGSKKGQFYANVIIEWPQTELKVL